MAQLYANNAKSSLASLVSDVAVTLPLQTGEGALFPSPTGGDFFLVTLYEIVAQVEQNHEIVKCTARSGDSLTVVRAQESTTAREWAADTPVELRITKGVMEALDGAVTDGDFSANGLMKRTAAGVYGIAVADTDYQSVPAEGAFANGDKTKLDGIESGADVTDTTNVTAAGALMDSEVDANLKTLSLPASTTISAYGATVVGVADEAAFKAAVNLEIGTDVLAQQTIGIADNNLLEVDGSPNVAEYARFTANGLEGRTESEFKADFNLEIGVDVQAYDADTLKADTADVLTAGYAGTPYNAGTQSSGTFTPDEANGNMQYTVNGGAHTLAPPTNNTTIIVQYTNNASAGAITTSGFTVVEGDAFTTTDGDDFVCFITKVNGFSILNVRAMQ